MDIYRIRKTHGKKNYGPTDGNPDAIAFCRGQWKDLPNLRFIESRIDALTQFGDASMDGIAFLEVIEHITEKQAAYVLEEFHRILKAGGRLVISTPNRKSLWPLLEFLMDLFRLAPRLKNDQHEKLYTGRELTAVAGSNGFIPAGEQRINCLSPWIAVFSEKYAARTHEWELRQKWLPGALLLYTFIK